MAERDGKLTGTVIAGFDGWRCRPYRLAVHPGHRRRGVATALLAAAEERFMALGERRGDAMVLDEKGTAHHAWGAAGYERLPRWGRRVTPLAPDDPRSRPPRGRPGVALRGLLAWT